MGGQGINSEHVHRSQQVDRQYVRLKGPGDECTTTGRGYTRLRGICLLGTGLLIASTVILYFVLLSVDQDSVPYQVHLIKSVYRASLYSMLHTNDTSMLPPRQAAEHTDSGDGMEKVVSCYYNTPDPRDANQLMPSHIYPFLCTHINVAFARIVNKQIYMDPSQRACLLDIVKLKQINPKLKILLSIGGSGNDAGFSDMVVDHASRKVFIKSIKSVLRNYTLDGIDLDWEFPALHYFSDESGSRERQHFSQLLREIRTEYFREKRDYLLTVAAAAPETIVDISYDVDQLNAYVDYVNIMTYDFHSYTKYTPFTGFNSPLYARPTEQLYLATLNINYTVHMYLNKGLDRSKIVVGIPTYGHTFTLVNPNNYNIGSPASGYGTLGGMGFVNYPDICSFLRKNGNDSQVQFDNAAKVPYMHSHQEWASYDTPLSVMDKANYIKDNRLRGAMIYSLNADDYSGVCAGGTYGHYKFPLAQSVHNTLISNVNEQ